MRSISLQTACTVEQEMAKGGLTLMPTRTGVGSGAWQVKGKLPEGMGSGEEPCFSCFSIALKSPHVFLWKDAAGIAARPPDRHAEDAWFTLTHGFHFVFVTSRMALGL